MANFNPEKLHLVYKDSVDSEKLKIPRKYTLTHSDSTGDLFLTIGSEYDYKQISSFYTRFMRDEVLAEWQLNNNIYELHVYLHVSGGFVFGWASLRDRIFRSHLPLVLKVIRYGDKLIFESLPILNESPIYIHFNSKNKKYNKFENYGQIKEFNY
ncbi:MAG: staygreen family protein [Candidatus Hodarchaeota archaeon]